MFFLGCPLDDWTLILLLYPFGLYPKGLIRNFLRKGLVSLVKYAQHMSNFFYTSLLLPENVALIFLAEKVLVFGCCPYIQSCLIWQKCHPVNSWLLFVLQISWIFAPLLYIFVLAEMSYLVVTQKVVWHKSLTVSIILHTCWAWPRGLTSSCGSKGPLFLFEKAFVDINV